MENANKVFLRGTIGTIKVVNGTARMSLATHRAFRNENGEAVIETTWTPVVAHQTDGMPELDLLGKLTTVEIEGRLRSQRYTDAEGNERASLEVVAKSIKVVNDKLLCEF